MKKLILACMALALVCISFAYGPAFKPLNFNAQTNVPPSTWSGAGFYDIRLKKFSAVVVSKLHDLTINGKPTRFEFDGFVGANVDSQGHAVAGISISRKWQWFDQFFFSVGGAVSFNGGAPVGGGFTIGAGFTFGG